MNQPRHETSVRTMEYDGRWIPLSAEQFRQYRFRETAVGRRGIRPDDVQDAMNRAAYEIEQWRLRFQRAQTENTRLRDWFKREGIDVDTRRPRQPAEEATRLLIIAQREADQVLAAAHAQASHVHADAVTQAEEIIEQARHSSEHAARQYRAAAGATYNADLEELVRLRNWAGSILSLLTATETHLGVVASELTRMLGTHADVSMPASPPISWPTRDPATTH
jgi:hypothetical protein